MKSPYPTVRNPDRAMDRLITGPFSRDTRHQASLNPVVPPLRPVPERAMAETASLPRQGGQAPSHFRPPAQGDDPTGEPVTVAFPTPLVSAFQPSPAEPPGAKTDADRTKPEKISTAPPAPPAKTPAPDLTGGEKNRQTRPESQWHPEEAVRDRNTPARTFPGNAHEFIDAASLSDAEPAGGASAGPAPVRERIVKKEFRREIIRTIRPPQVPVAPEAHEISKPPSPPETGGDTAAPTRNRGKINQRFPIPSGPLPPASRNRDMPGPSALEPAPMENPFISPTPKAPPAAANGVPETSQPVEPRPSVKNRPAGKAPAPGTPAEPVRPVPVSPVPAMPSAGPGTPAASTGIRGGASLRVEIGRVEITTTKPPKPRAPRSRGIRPRPHRIAPRLPGLAGGV